jgi:DNA-directed RNA polymerase subunit beta'
MVNIMALTDKDTDQLAGTREIKNAETVDWRTMKPKAGGLFDASLTGGPGGNRWAYIKLHEPLPSPVMEEPIRRILGLTEKQLHEIIQGKQELKGRTGPVAIKEALDRLNLTKEIERARAEIHSGKRTARDAAVRRLGYLRSAERLGIHPRDWVISKVPVLPPAFRPVLTGPKNLPMVADANFLYKELFDANKMVGTMQTAVGEDIGDERLATYQALKGVTGLGDPIHPKNQERQVRGILKHVFGASPKLGTVQRRLLGSSVDFVGRSVITPNPDLDMDQVAVPENSAWEIYRPFVIRRLVQSGMPRLQAARVTKERSAAAREALVAEMSQRPVIVNRAPTLHRYGIMAAWPRLTKNSSLEVSPLTVKGFGADFDGDAVNYHVPTTPEAVQEAVDKLLPSRNLLSVTDFKAQHMPSQEYVGGLYEASARVDTKNKPRVFATVADAIRAYRRGEIDVDRQVEILNQ